MNARAGGAWTGLLGFGIHGVYDPHHDSTHEQRRAHDVKAFEMLTDDFGEQKRGNRSDYESDDGKAKRMRQCGAIAAFAARKRGEEVSDALAKVNGQNEYRAQLDNDGVHLPITAGKVDAQKRLGQAEMRGGADRQKFGETFHDPQQD